MPERPDHPVPGKQKPEEPADDGHVIADMNVEGMPWYSRQRRKDEREARRAEFRALNMTPKERRAMILGAIGAILPWLLLYALIFFLVFLLLDLLWIR